jgi:hypothetical protein
VALVFALAGWATWVSFTAITGILTLVSAVVSFIALVAARHRRGLRIALAAAVLSSGLVLFLGLTLRFGCCSTSSTDKATHLRSASARVGQPANAYSLDSHTLR